MSKKRGKKLIYVDFQKLEKRSYKSLDSLGKEIIDKMVELNKPRSTKLTSPQRARLDLADAALSELTDHQKDVLGYIFGLDGKPRLSERETAKELGISRVSVHHIKTRALASMRNKIVLNENVVKNIKRPS